MSVTEDEFDEYIHMAFWAGVDAARYGVNKIDAYNDMLDEIEEKRESNA